MHVNLYRPRRLNRRNKIPAKFRYFACRFTSASFFTQSLHSLYLNLTLIYYLIANTIR